MHCRPPTPPLFPYTTLFRSVSGSPSGSRASAVTVDVRPRNTVHGSHRARSVGGRFCACTGGAAGGSGDRKSTRLNSSHLVISYAVFCLKKKNSLVHTLSS